MEYRQLGTTGVRVSPLCLGAMNFGGPTEPSEAIHIIRAALDAGINFIDTANVYQDGRSEEIVGEAIADRRDDVVLATKVFNPVGDGPNDRGTSRRAIVREVDRSLRRLDTDWIDLYQMHRHDETTPLEESLRALDDLVRAGKIRYVGVSTFPAWRLTQAHWIADMRGFTPIVTEQPPYNVLEREVEDELLPACRELGMGVIPWSPLAGGLLTDRFVGGATPESRVTENFDLSGPMWDPVQEAIDRLVELAREAGTTLTRFALAWLRDAPGVTAPIIGPRTPEHLDEALASLDDTVTEDQRDIVDDIVTPRTSLWLRAAYEEVAERDDEGDAET